MKTHEFDIMPEEDDIVLQLEQFKVGLVNRATGGEIEEKEYSKSRKMILGIPRMKERMPRFLQICRTTDEYWAWIKAQAPTYAERRKIIAEAINPILEILEYETGEGALEFKKNYEEKEIIGNGGFGQVYLYEHRLLKMPFAVKVFAPAFYEGGEKEIERFFQEARMLFQFNHPSIIKVYDVGLIGKRPFIRMEYFKGQNLNEILNNHGTLDVNAALIMMEQLVSGMNHAHEDVGIIHRDLKPSNIMAARPKQFRIIDFGMSIFIENELHSRLTKTGEATVSGYYNAPELVENPKLIDKRSDIYSLGALWYTMLSGQPPAGTSLMKNLEKITGIDSDYIGCIEKCLANLESRTSNCAILLSEIEKLKYRYNNI
ncbi:MAG: serine/threonine protein kinase [Candidatus Electrothrix sp. AR1]|nr:serine/threonine protein kinase [Candidatus Electrothrix sp. AR1]